MKEPERISTFGKLKKLVICFMDLNAFEMFGERAGKDSKAFAIIWRSQGAALRPRACLMPTT
jgi:hypothetical protein